MLNTSFRSSWLIGAWVSAVGIGVVASMALGANPSTTALVIALGIAPGVIIAILAYGQPSPSVAQILNSIERNDRS